MTNEIKTVDDLRGAYLALISGTEEVTTQRVRSDKRQHIQNIEEMALPGSGEQTFEARYTKPISTGTYAKVAMKKAKEQGNAWLNGAKNDAGHLDDVREETPGNGEQDEFMDAIKSMGDKK